MPLCDSGCGNDAVVHWQRRPNATELAQIVATETARRDAITALSDPELPPPAFPPLPSAADTVMAVYACVGHALTLDLAGHIHASGCSGPKSAALPQCDCTPEPLPAPNADDSTSAGPTLPAGWS